MGKFTKFLDATATVLEATANRRVKIDNLTDQIVTKSHGRVSASEARKVAEVLVNHPEITY